MIIYTCKDQFEDMMTASMTPGRPGEGHKNIRLMTEPVYEPELFCQYRHVDSDPDKSRKVVRSIQRQISFPAYQMVFRCAMSCLPDKLDRIYRFLLLGFPVRRRQFPCCSILMFFRFFEASRAVQNETHHFREFLSLPGSSGRDPGCAYRTEIRYSLPAFPGF